MFTGFRFQRLFVCLIFTYVPVLIVLFYTTSGFNRTRRERRMRKQKKMKGCFIHSFDFPCLNFYYIKESSSKTLSHRGGKVTVTQTDGFV